MKTKSEFSIWTIDEWHCTKTVAGSTIDVLIAHKKKQKTDEALDTPTAINKPQVRPPITQLSTYEKKQEIL